MNTNERPQKGLQFESKTQNCICLWMAWFLYYRKLLLTSSGRRQDKRYQGKSYISKLASNL